MDAERKTQWLKLLHAQAGKTHPPRLMEKESEEERDINRAHAADGGALGKSQEGDSFPQIYEPAIIWAARAFPRG